MDTINLGKITIPIIKPEKGIDYYTPTEKQEIITEVLENVNSVIAPQEQARQSAEISRTEAETQRQLNESTRQSNEVNREDAEELRASAEITRQSNEADRISAEETRDSTFTAKMEAVDDAIADIQDKTTAYNNNATQKTADFNDNATSKINAFNLNATNKTNDFNDNVTSKIADFDEHVTEFQEQIDSKQDEIDSSNKLSSDLVDDTNHTHKFVSAEEKETWNAKYNKPNGGIPKTDLTNEVQTSLGKADTALQQHQDISGKEDESNKVTSIDDESTDIQYPSAKCVYDSQQNQNAKIVKLELENQRLKETLPTTTGSGENITLNKTAEMEFVVPPLPEGNTVQDGEPTPTVPVEVQVVKGDVEVKVQNKNLLDKENEISQGSTNLATDTTRVSIRVKHKLKANTTYTVITNLNTGNFLWAFVLGTKVSPWSNAEQLYDTGWKNTNYWSYTTSQECYINIPIRNSSNTNININDVKDYWVMLYEGAYNSNVSYTPHQEQKLPLYLPVENLANMEYFKENYTLDGNGLPVASSNRVTNTTPINVKSFDNVVVSFKNNTSNTINFIYSILDVNNNLISRVAGNINKTSIDTSNAEYLYVCFYDNVTLQSISEIQIEPGSKANHYTPFGTIPIELCKIGDYKDYFYKDNSKWYLYKEIEKIIVDGTENWNATNRIDNTTKFFVLTLSNRTSILSTQPTTGELCNKLIQNNPYTLIGNYFWIYDNGSISVLRIGLEDDDITTAQQIKIWLSNNNLTVYYPLKNPTDIEITDTTLINQLEAINNAISYYEQTNISGTSSGINPLFDVEAYQSTKLLLEDIINSN